MAVLTQNEITALFNRYIEVRSFIVNQNNNQPINQKIKQIQIPSSLTESIIFHYIVANPTSIGQDNIDQTVLIRGNSRTFDLTYNGLVNIEVKATGANNFQRFRPHALTANYVFWLNLTENRQYSIAIFNPNILTPNRRGEVDITWNRLIENNVTLIENLTL